MQECDQSCFFVPRKSGASEKKDCYGCMVANLEGLFNDFYFKNDFVPVVTRINRPRRKREKTN